MLEINTNVINGTIVIRMEGDLNTITINKVEKEIDYFIYRQGMQYFIFDFNCIEDIDLSIINNLSNKLIEILLVCGKVVFCGTSKLFKGIIDKGDRIVYVNQVMDAFKYFSF